MLVKSKIFILIFLLLLISSCSKQGKTRQPLEKVAAKKDVISLKNDVKEKTVVSKKVEENIEEDVKVDEGEWEEVVLIEEEEEDDEIDIEKGIEEIEDEEIWIEGEKLPYVFELSIGESGMSLGDFDNPVDAAFDEDGNLYVVDQGNNRIQKFDEDGEVLLEWGRWGVKEGKFDEPSAIAIDEDNYVYVVDTKNHRIQKFDSKGNFILSWGKLGSRKGYFNSPMDVAINDKGYIFVADTDNHRIQRFDSNGKFIKEWTEFDVDGGEFSSPISIAYTEEDWGYIYVLDSEDYLLQQFEINGELVKSWKVIADKEEKSGKSKRRKEKLGKPRRVEVDDEDFIYIIDEQNNTISKFNSDGELITSWGKGEIEFKNPRGVAINEDDEIFVVDSGNNIIQKFVPY